MFRPKKYWIGVVSREHALVGMSQGFVQVCHGKSAPLKKMKAHDGFIFYSPKKMFDGDEKCQKFTGVGAVVNGDVYQVDMGNGFKPFRIDVKFSKSEECSIHPLIENLSFIKSKKNWGYSFKFGLLEISEQDFLIITSAMKVGLKKEVEKKQLSETKCKP